MHHGVTFNFDSGKVCSPAIFMSTPPGVDILFLLFPLFCIPLVFLSFQGKVFSLSLPNLVWMFIGLIPFMGLLLVKIAV